MSHHFDASLFVDIRERLNLSVTPAISELVLAHHIDKLEKQQASNQNISSKKHNDQDDKAGNEKENNEKILHKELLLMDATVAPQNITFPTDLKVLNSARGKS
jgi:hypothetical protein